MTQSDFFLHDSRRPRQLHSGSKNRTSIKPGPCTSHDTLLVSPSDNNEHTGLVEMEVAHNVVVEPADGTFNTFTLVASVD